MQNLLQIENVADMNTLGGSLVSFLQVNDTEKCQRSAIGTEFAIRSDSSPFVSKQKQAVILMTGSIMSFTLLSLV